MVPNRISDELLPEVRDEILEDLAAIQANLPFLIGLASGERRRLSKASNRGHAFMHKALNVGRQIPGYMPAALDLDEMQKDLALMDAMYPVMVAVSQLAEKLSDTYAVVGSEAYASARLIYQNGKRAKGVEGLEQTMAELAKHFARRPAAKTSRKKTGSDDSAK